MKKLYLIGGTMGVGKTTVCQIMKEKLNNSVFLDGDWCWDMHPFQVTDETKKMVMNNICFLLNSYLKCSVYDNIIFGWVMDQQATINEIIGRLDTGNCQVSCISLICNETALREHLRKDIASGIRTEAVLSRSVERLPLYEQLNTHKLDVSELWPETAADFIINNY